MPTAQGRTTIRRRPKDGNPGADAVRYWLVPSVTQIKKTADGKFNPTSVSCKRMKSSGNSAPVETTEGTMQYRVAHTDGSVSAYSNYASAVTVPENCQSINFLLKINSVEAASETVSVIADGNGITNVKEYYAKSSSSTDAPAKWAESVPELDSTDKYLWNYESITYSSGAVVNTTPAVIGVFGKGISSVTNYYLATSKSSGVTTDKSEDWTTEVQSPTATKRYLWNYEKIEYTSGNPTTTTPHIIGVYGEKGDDGPPGDDGPKGDKGDKGNDGDDAVMYWLIPSVTAISKSKAGAFSPTSVSCKVMKRVGSGAAEEVTDMYVRYKFTYTNNLTMYFKEYTGAISISGLVRSLEFELYSGGLDKSMRHPTTGATYTEATGSGAMLDNVSVPVVIDGSDGTNGKDGKDGPQGIQGCIYRRTKWAEGFEYHNDSQLDTDGLRFIDLVYIMEKENSLFASKAHWYRCRETHASESTNAPQLTNTGIEPWLAYWEKVNGMDPIYTPLLLADDAVITLLQSNQILIENDEGKVSAGLSGSLSGKKIRFWAGSEKPDEAPFRVDADGNLIASKGTFSGLVLPMKTVITSDNYMKYLKGGSGHDAKYLDFRKLTGHVVLDKSLDGPVSQGKISPGLIMASRYPNAKPDIDNIEDYIGSRMRIVNNLTLADERGLFFITGLIVRTESFSGNSYNIPPGHEAIMECRIKQFDPDTQMNSRAKVIGWWMHYFGPQ